MAEISHLVSAKQINSIPPPFPVRTSSLKPFQQTSRISASSNPKKHNNSLIAKRSPKNPKRVIRISTSHGKWQGTWTCDFLVSLQDLQLEDLIEDGPNNADVFINLCIKKHASFGFSVDGRIITSFTRKCSICSSPYCKEIDTNFNVLVLPTSRESRENRGTRIPEIGGDDPSVIYVKPGAEADFDSLIQDTIRLTASAKDTCSELCEKSEPTLQFIGEQNTASLSKRWSGLLKLRNL